MNQSRTKDVTTAVLSELQLASDPRFREIMSAFVPHLHDFARASETDGEEFHAAIRPCRGARQAQQRVPQRGRADVRIARPVALICLLNNGDHGATETDQNMLGPFWRMHSPVTRTALDRTLTDDRGR